MTVAQQLPFDDDEIENDDQIIRRINPDHHIVFDSNRNCYRVSSKAFSPSSGENGGMSVDLPKLITEAGISVEEFITTPTFTASVIFKAEVVREVGLLVGKTPQENNPYHADVWGQNKPNRFSNGQKKALQRSAEWLVNVPNIPDVEL